MCHAEVVARYERLAADGDRVVVAGHHLAHEIDARHQRRDARDLALRDGGQRVLVVDARPADANGDLAVGQVGGGQGRRPAIDAVVALRGEEGREGVGDLHVRPAG
jgi:hypothetical protein